MSTETEFENIEVDISTDDQRQLIAMYVRERLRPESVSAYQSAMDAGEDVRQALYDAVLNDMIVAALIAQINTTQQPDDQQTQISKN